MAIGGKTWCMSRAGGGRSSRSHRRREGFAFGLRWIAGARLCARSGFNEVRGRTGEVRNASQASKWRVTKVKPDFVVATIP
jgi:hypothetical protein